MRHLNNAGNSWNVRWMTRGSKSKRDVVVAFHPVTVRKDGNFFLRSCPFCLHVCDLRLEMDACFRLGIDRARGLTGSRQNRRVPFRFLFYERTAGLLNTSLAVFQFWPLSPKGGRTERDVIQGWRAKVTAEGKELRCLPHWAPSSSSIVSCDRPRKTKKDRAPRAFEEKGGKGKGMKGHENRIDGKEFDFQWGLLVALMGGRHKLTRLTGLYEISTTFLSFCPSAMISSFQLFFRLLQLAHHNLCRVVEPIVDRELPVRFGLNI